MTTPVDLATVPGRPAWRAYVREGWAGSRAGVSIPQSGVRLTVEPWTRADWEPELTTPIVNVTPSQLRAIADAMDRVHRMTHAAAERHD